MKGKTVHRNRRHHPSSRPLLVQRRATTRRRTEPCRRSLLSSILYHIIPISDLWVVLRCAASNASRQSHAYASSLCDSINAQRFMPILRLRIAPDLPNPRFFFLPSAPPASSSPSSLLSSVVGTDDGVPLRDRDCFLARRTSLGLGAGVGVSIGASSSSCSSPSSPSSSCPPSARRALGSLDRAEGGRRAAVLRARSSESRHGHVFHILAGRASSPSGCRSPWSPGYSVSSHHSREQRRGGDAQGTPRHL